MKENNRKMTEENDVLTTAAKTQWASHQNQNFKTDEINEKFKR